MKILPYLFSALRKAIPYFATLGCLGLSAIAAETSKFHVKIRLEFESPKDLRSYRILESVDANKIILVYKGKESLEKTRSIPKGLTQKIYHDFLSLAWAARYKNNLPESGPCKNSIRIVIDQTENVTICEKQRTSFEKAGSLEKHLEELMSSPTLKKKNR